MKFYAHSKEGVPPENWQELEEHPQNVASFSEEFAKRIFFGEMLVYYIYTFNIKRGQNAKRNLLLM